MCGKFHPAHIHFLMDRIQILVLGILRVGRIHLDPEPAICYPGIDFRHASSTRPSYACRSSETYPLHKCKRATANLQHMPQNRQSLVTYDACFGECLKPFSALLYRGENVFVSQAPRAFGQGGDERYSCVVRMEAADASKIPSEWRKLIFGERSVCICNIFSALCTTLDTDRRHC